MGCQISKNGKKEYVVKYSGKKSYFEIYKNNEIYANYNYKFNRKNMNMKHIEKTLEKGLNKKELKIIKIKNSNNLNCTITINRPKLYKKVI